MKQAARVSSIVRTGLEREIMDQAQSTVRSLVLDLTVDQVAVLNVFSISRRCLAENGASPKHADRFRHTGDSSVARVWNRYATTG